MHAKAALTVRAAFLFDALLSKHFSVPGTCKLEILYPGRPGTLLNIALGYSLILVTIWSTHAVQRKLFWIDVAFFVSVAVLAFYRSPGLDVNGPGLQERQRSNSVVRFLPRRFRMQPPQTGPFRFMPVSFSRLQFSVLMISLGLITGLAVVLVSAELGTLHGLTYKPRPLFHVAMYIIWAVVQQWIQQAFFFVRLERIIHSGVLASFTTAALFGLAHLPNPVLTPLTFVGGWLLSEIYRRYRSVVPLGIAHGLVGIAIALAVPDQINHHMRVGLGYLQYMR
jgi:membrane protease YdiL (CAAX protease family)